MATLGPLSQHAHALDLLCTLVASSVAASASVSPSFSHPSQKSWDHQSGQGWPEVTFFLPPLSPSDLRRCWAGWNLFH